MIPSMEPPITSSESCRLEFPLPLSWENALTVQLLKERYIGKDGVVFLTFERDDKLILICPAVPKRIGHGRKDFDPNEFTTPASSTLRIPDGAGAING